MRGPKAVTTRRARGLRRVENDAEAVLWSELRNRRLNRYKFVRQFPIGPYFADFACREQMLVIEVDGSQHAEGGYDRRRDEDMSAAGWFILRFWNVDVLKERKAVLDTILAALEGRLDGNIVAHDLRYLAVRAEKEQSS